jgi:uncharacterized protein (TIGR03067 family)
MLRIAVPLLLSLSLLGPGDPAKKGTPQELKSLEGTWELTSLVTGGKEQPLPKDVPVLLTLKGGEFTFGLGDTVMDRGTFTSDPAARPKHIDATSAVVNPKGGARPGIYELKDDLLKMCVAPAGKDRPAKFASTAGTGVELLTYKRVLWETDTHRQTHWYAFIQGPPSVVRFVMTLERTGDRIVSGTLDIPDLRQKGLPLGTITNYGRKLTIISPSKTQRIEGEIAPDGRRIAGTLKAGTGADAPSQPIVFSRLDKVPDFFSRPQEPKGSPPYHAEDVTFANKAAGVKLAGTLTFPKDRGPVPAVVLISMSGPQDRDATEFGHKLFLVLADFLTRQGIAVLRYDDRGVGKSTGKFAGATSADFAEDAQAAVEYLKSRKEIDPKAIGLIGHSEGGVVAPLVATKSRDVAFLVLLAGPALPGEEVALLQTPLMQQTFGATEKQIDFNMALQKRFFAVLKEEKDDAAAERKVRSAIKEEFGKLPEADRKEMMAVKDAFEKQMVAPTFPWHRYFLSHDPRPVMGKVSCPVLALFGEKDIQVPPGHHAKEMEKALRAGRNKDVTVKVIPRANHLFQKCTFGSVHEYCAIPQTISPEVLELIAGWIREKTGGQK